MSPLELAHPADFFREQITTARHELSVQLDADVEFYLVNLMCEFVAFGPSSQDDGVDMFETPLALVVKEALEQSPSQQLKLFRKLGDTSLYITGYFRDSFNRKTIDADYYMNMGSLAYKKVARLIRDLHGERSFHGIYQSLSEEFQKLVAIVTEVSEGIGFSGNQSLITVYERWAQTGSKKLLKILEDEGIVPIQSYQSYQSSRKI